MRFYLQSLEASWKRSEHRHHLFDPPCRKETSSRGLCYPRNHDTVHEILMVLKSWITPNRPDGKSTTITLDRLWSLDLLWPLRSRWDLSRPDRPEQLQAVRALGVSSDLSWRRWEAFLEHVDFRSVRNKGREWLGRCGHEVEDVTRVPWAQSKKPGSCGLQKHLHL